jgi:hemerythrin-like domain-containing protein
MHVLQILQAEHQDIERVLTLLERACVAARAGRSPAPCVFQRLADFFLVHAEGSHHEKEHALFEAMALQSLPVDHTLLPTMHGEHTLGRELAEDLDTAVGAWAAGGEQAPVLEAAARYVRHQRSHAAEEERRVFPLVQRLLPAHLLEPVRARYACTELARGRLEDAAQLLRRELLPELSCPTRIPVAVG